MKKSACDACGGRNLRVIYSRTRMPAFQNLLFGTEEEARKTPTAAVDLAACGDCGLVFNSLFEANLMEYDADYQNAQDHSPSFRAYLEEIADLVIARAGEKARYAEIGCGKGFFLGIMKERGCDIVGFDPAYEGAAPEVRKAYFDASAARGLCVDAVIMRHTLEHIEKPYDFLKRLKGFLPGDTRIFIEVPRFEWIVEEHAFWDVFHEHCNYFTEDFFRNVFGGQAEIIPTFGNQYMVVCAKLGSIRDAMGAVAAPSCYGGVFEDAAARYADALAGGGAHYVWGAGAKGIAFANVLDPERRRIRAVIDINPRKQGRFLPLSAHPCVPPESVDWASLAANDCLWIMNPNYTQEILDTLPALPCKVRVLGE